jgi:hypothetical protein
VQNFLNWVWAIGCSIACVFWIALPFTYRLPQEEGQIMILLGCGLGVLGGHYIGAVVRSTTNQRKRK